MKFWLDTYNVNFEIKQNSKKGFYAGQYSLNLLKLFACPHVINKQWKNVWTKHILGLSGQQNFYQIYPKTKKNKMISSAHCYKLVLSKEQNHVNLALKFLKLF